MIIAGKEGNSVEDYRIATGNTPVLSVCYVNLAKGKEREGESRGKIIFPPMRPAGKTALWNITFLGASVNFSNLATSA